MLTITDILRRHGDGYLERFWRGIPAAHVRAIRDILSCRTDELGGKIIDCLACGARQFVHYCCRNRACPRCHGQETVDWLAGRARELLPVRYFHVVFTLPSELRELTRRHRRVALALLMQTAAEALQVLAMDPRFCGGRIGILAVLHTWTRALLWHAHVHCLVPAVTIEEDGTWRRTNPEFLVHVKALSRLFRGKFLAALRRELPDVALPSGYRRHDWVTFCRPCGEGPKNVLAYVARYVFGGPMRGRRILGMEDGRYILEYRDTDSGRLQTVHLTPHELIRRFLQHTPERGFHRMRYYGFWARSKHPVLRTLQLQLGPGLADAVQDLIRAAEARKDARDCCPLCGSALLIVRTAWRRGASIPCIRAPPDVSVSLPV